LYTEAVRSCESLVQLGTNTAVNITDLTGIILLWELIILFNNYKIEDVSGTTLYGLL
jgi:hypothetical protein